MAIGRRVGIHVGLQPRHHRRRIRDQIDAAPAEGAVGLVVVGERLGIRVLAADERQALIQHPEFAVLIGVSLVIAERAIGAQVVDVPAGLRDLLDDPELLIADAAGRAALQRHGYLHPGARPGGDHLTQARVVERIALEADALLRGFQPRS